MTLSSLSTHAGVLPKKTKLIRIGTSVSTANALWQGEDATDFGDDGERRAVSNDLTYSVGLGNRWQLDVKAIYMKAEMTKGQAADAIEDDKEEGLSEISVMGTKSWKTQSKLKQVSRFGLGAPGSSNGYESEEMFLAVNEGTTKLYLGHGFSFKTTKRQSIDLDLNYTHRFEARKPDSITAQLRYAIGFKKFGIVPYIDYYNALGGIDIGSDEFGARSAELSKVKPRAVFSQKAEQFTGVGINSYYVIKPKWIVDFFYMKKVEGKNTDVGTNYGIGFTHIL